MARFCILVVLATAALVLLVWPWTNRQIVELRDRYEQRSDLSRVAPGQFQTSANGRRVFFIDNQPQLAAQDAASASAAAGASGAASSASGTKPVSTTQGVGRNVFVLDNSGDRESITTAEGGWLETDAQGRRTLVLSHGTRADLDLVTGNKTLSQFQEQSLLVSERAAARLDEAPPKVHDTLTLLTSDAAPLKGELVWRVGLALCGINLVLLGAGLAAGGPRRQAGSWTMLLALLGFMVYTNLINLTQAWVVAGRQGVGAALFTVHGTAALLGITLLWWRDSGAARYALRRR